MVFDILLSLYDLTNKNVLYISKGLQTKKYMWQIPYVAHKA